MQEVQWQWLAILSAARQVRQGPVHPSHSPGQVSNSRQSPVAFLQPPPPQKWKGLGGQEVSSQLSRMSLPPPSMVSHRLQAYQVEKRRLNSSIAGGCAAVVHINVNIPVHTMQACS